MQRIVRANALLCSSADTSYDSGLPAITRLICCHSMWLQSARHANSKSIREPSCGCGVGLPIRGHLHDASSKGRLEVVGTEIVVGSLGA